MTSRHDTTLRDGSRAVLHRFHGSLWACPVCASVEHETRPYEDGGAASFEICSCGFQFGYDCDPGASPQAVASVQANWAAWRAWHLSALGPVARANARHRLQLIGIED